MVRAGSSLINRLFISNAAAILSSSPAKTSILKKFPIDRNPNLQDLSVVGEAETLKRIASPEGTLFPCGLPSLRFFIDEGEDAFPNNPLLLLPKRTYQPSHIKRKRTHGYLARKATKGGRKVIKRRIAKGRARIAVRHRQVIALTKPFLQEA